MPRISSRLLAVVCIGEWPHNPGFCLVDVCLEDVAMNIDGLSTHHWAMAALRNSASEVYHLGFAKTMVVDTRGDRLLRQLIAEAKEGG